MTTSKPEGKRRHRWNPVTHTCALCGMQRFFVRDGGPRGGMVFEYVHLDQPHERRPRDKAAPPCSGVKP